MFRHEEWREGTKVTKEENLNLPIPRLEIRYFPINEDGFNLLAVYSLIYKHFIGHIINVPLGRTRIENPDKTPMDRLDKNISLPFRDGTHIKNEKKQLNLPAYVIWEDKYQII